jgi:hypothetical protein
MAGLLHNVAGAVKKQWSGNRFFALRSMRRDARYLPLVAALLAPLSTLLAIPGCTQPVRSESLRTVQT